MHSLLSMQSSPDRSRNLLGKGKAKNHDSGAIHVTLWSITEDPVSLGVPSSLAAFQACFPRFTWEFGLLRSQALSSLQVSTLWTSRFLALRNFAGRLTRQLFSSCLLACCRWGGNTRSYRGPLHTARQEVFRENKQTNGWDVAPSGKLKTTKISSCLKSKLHGCAPLETPHLRKRLSSSDRTIGSVGAIAAPSSAQGLALSSHCWKSTVLTAHFAFPALSGISLPRPPALRLHRRCSVIPSSAQTEENRISV